MMQILRDAFRGLRPADVWLPWVSRGMKVLLILVGAWLLTRIAGRLLSQARIYTIGIVNLHRDSTNRDLEKRAATILIVFRKLVNSLIWMVALVAKLRTWPSLLES